MLIRVKGVYRKTKPLANGRIGVYWYHRATGAALKEAPGTPEFLAEVRQLDGGGKTPQPAAKTVKHLVNEYRASAHFAGLARGTKSEYRRHLARIEAVFGPHAVKSIKRAHVEKFTQKFSNKPTTARAVHTVLVLLFSFAVDRLGWLDINPLLGMNRRQRKKQTGRAPYSEAQIDHFRQRNPLGTLERLAFEIGLATGLRISDIAGVPAELLDEAFFALCTRKTGELVVVARSSGMKAAWDAWRARLAAGGVVPAGPAVCNPNGSAMHKRTLSKKMAEAYDRAGFPGAQRTHALRYTAAIRLLENGHSYDDIAEHIGHRMVEMAKKYCEKRRNAEARGRAIDTFEESQRPAAE